MPARVRHSSLPGAVVVLAGVVIVVRGSIGRAEDSARPPEAADPADIDAALADGLRRRTLGDLRGALRVFQAVATSGQPALRAAVLCEAGSTAQEMGLVDEAWTA